MRIAAGIEYDGTDFHGWEAQRNIRTVQHEVEQAFSRVADHGLKVVCAGRTDAGVHATGQVVHFDTVAMREEQAWMRGANANLPDDVCVRWARPVDHSFHARFRALRRTYRYLILNQPVRSALARTQASWVYLPLLVESMAAGAQWLIGEHDFSAFRASGCQARSAVRQLYRLEVRRLGDWIVIEISANAFLQHMVRNIVGVLVAIGSGRRNPIWAQEVLLGRDRRQAGVTAAAQGLCLEAIDYAPQYDLPTGEAGVGRSPLPRHYPPPSPEANGNGG